MPLYVYEPTVYSESEEVTDCCFFETLQSLSEAPHQQCPTCGHAIHRAVAAFSFSVKSSVARSSAGQNLGAGGSSAGLIQGSGPQTGQSGQSAAPEPTSAAGRAARMAMRHVCATGCRH